MLERFSPSEGGSASEQDGGKKDTKVRIMRRDEVFDAPRPLNKST
jgi:hypothetical protein